MFAPQASDFPPLEAKSHRHRSVRAHTPNANGREDDRRRSHRHRAPRRRALRPPRVRLPPHARPVSAVSAAAPSSMKEKWIGATDRRASSCPFPASPSHVAARDVAPNRSTRTDTIHPPNIEPPQARRLQPPRRREGSRPRLIHPGEVHHRQGGRHRRRRHGRLQARDRREQGEARAR